MSDSAETVALQSSLRAALQSGSIAGVKAAIAPQKPTWKASFRNLIRGQVCATPSFATASLEYVHSDDSCNLPVHYLATGRPAQGMQHLLQLLRNTEEQQDQARADVATWLSSEGKFIDVAAVNADLDTCMHCAVKSSSPLTMQALLLMASAQNQLLAPIVAAKNLQDLQALDLALESRQWFAVQLLVQAGALHDSPALEQARAYLQEAMPAQQPAAQSSLASLVSGVGKVFSAWLGPTLPQPSDPNLASSSQQQQPTQAFALANTLPASPSNSASPQLIQVDCNMTTEDLAMSVVYTPGRVGTGVAGHPNAQQSAPLLILPDLKAVLQWRQECVQQIASQCCVHESVAVLLLDRHQGGAEKACTAWSCNPQGALEHCGMSAEMAKVVLNNSQAHAPAATNVRCLVCFEDITAAAGSPRCTIDLLCHHCTCDTCWQGILEAALSEGDMKQIACPHPSCRLPLPLQLAVSLLNTAQAQRYQQLLAQHHVDTNPHIHWCPASDCTCSIALQCNQDTSSSSIVQAVMAGSSLDVTCSCGHAFCFVCLAPAHEPATCQQVQQWEALLAKAREEDKLNAMQWVQSNTQPCPSCGAPIQRNGGCNHISCTVCRHHFCWVCGGNWTDHNMNTGGSWRCNLGSAPSADNPNDPSGSTNTSSASGSGLASSNFFTAVLGRVADAGMKWRLEHFMRRYMAHECRHRQLQVSMQWMQALLQSGLPKSMWHTTQQQHLQQQQQHQPSLQPPVAAESVASPSGSMPTTSANPVQNRMQDPGLKNLAASYSSSSKPTHQAPMSAAQDSNLSQNQDQGHLSLDMRQRLQHQQQHLQRSPQTIVQQLPDNNLQAATSKSAYESHMAPSSGHMHHMGSVSAHHATGSHFMADMQNSAERNAFEYLQDLAAELVLCRLVLQSSYVLGYYLQGSSEQHRLLENFQDQLTGLVEQLSICLALLPGADILLQASPDALAQQLSSVPTYPPAPFTDAPVSKHSIPSQSSVISRSQLTSQLTSTQSAVPARTATAAAASVGGGAGVDTEQSEAMHKMTVALKAITRASAPSDGSLKLPVGGGGVHKQFMFAVAVHERAGAVKQLLQQLRVARQSLLKASQTGAFASDAQGPLDAKAVSHYARQRLPIEHAPSLAQVAQNVKYLWQGLV